jgi:glucokinase
MLLAGDIGGTKTVLALYALEQGPRLPIFSKTYPSKAYDSLEAVIEEFLAEHDEEVTHAAFGVAGPVVKDRAQITNLPWILEESRLEARFQLRAAHLLNDLEAVATSVPILQDDDLYVLNEGAVDPEGAIGVIAPGTGLGEGFLVWDGQRHRAFPCEGGHTDFGPVNELQQELLTYLQPRVGHVSYERVCSGIGIPNLYTFLRDSGRHEEPAWLAEQLETAADPTPLIVTTAQKEEVAICKATLELFIDILAHEASNLALKLLATGGIYLGGGIPPRILPQLEAANFMRSFTNKGRFADLLWQVPVRVICRRDAGLLGVAAHGLRLVNEQIGSQQTA